MGSGIFNWMSREAMQLPLGQRGVDIIGFECRLVYLRL